MPFSNCSALLQVLTSQWCFVGCHQVKILSLDVADEKNSLPSNYRYNIYFNDGEVLDPEDPSCKLPIDGLVSIDWLLHQKLVKNKYLMRWKKLF